jgi:hypothetical protein
LNAWSLPNNSKFGQLTFGGRLVQHSAKTKNSKILLPTNPNELGKLTNPPTKLKHSLVITQCPTLKCYEETIAHATIQI